MTDEPKKTRPGEKEPRTVHYDPEKVSGNSAKISELAGVGQSDSRANDNVESKEPPRPVVDGLAQTFKDRAQQARRDAEGTASASEQARLNKHADDLDSKARAAQQTSDTARRGRP